MYIPSHFKMTEEKAKLSQNHPIERRELVIDMLEQREGENERNIAAYMKELLQQG